MIEKKLVINITTIFLGITIFFFSYLEAANPKIVSKAAILYDRSSSTILYEKNKDMQRPPASLTKLVSCLVALNKVHDCEETVKCSAMALRRMSKKDKIKLGYQIEPYLLEPDAALDGLYVNEIISLETLLHGMFLPSANDSANVMAFHLSNGKINEFVEEMNQYVKELGCKNTHFDNPSGLHYPTHYSTAHDLLLIAKEALKFPKILDISKKPYYKRIKTNKQPERYMWSTNKLLRKGRFRKEYIEGLKTGNHENAGYCFIGYGKKHGQELLVVLLGAPTSELLFEDAIKLFEKGFSAKKVKRMLYNASESRFVNQTAKQRIEAKLKHDIYIEHYEDNIFQVEPKIIWDELSLPIKEGQKVGSLLIVSKEGDTFFKDEPLLSTASITKPKTIWPVVLVTFILFAIAAYLVVRFRVYKLLIQMSKKIEKLFRR